MNARTRSASIFSLFAGVILAGIVLVVQTAPEQPTASDVYDIKSLQATDPAQIIASETLSFASNVEGARCIAVDDQNRIYVGGQNRVRLWDKPVEEFRDITISAPARAIAVDPDGTLYVAFERSYGVFNIDGDEVEHHSYGEKSLLTGIAVAEGRVYVADAGLRLVHVHADDNAAPATLATPDPERGDDGVVIYRPSLAVAVGTDGLIRITDPGRHRVKLYAPDGMPVSAWESRPGMAIDRFSGCCNPAAIAVLSDLRIVTSEKGMPRVKLYDTDGAFVGVIVGADGFAGAHGGEHEAAVAVDANDRLYVLDPVDGRVRIFQLNEDEPENRK